MAERIDGRKRYEVEYAINSGGSGGGGGSGTVTSVALSAPTGLTVGGSPVTSSGTLALTFTAGYSIPTTASQTNWDTAYTATSGLGNSATRNVGTTAGTVAAGDDSRFVTDLGYTASTRVLTSSTGADVTLPLLSSADAGLAPASGGGTAKFLRADNTWAVPAISVFTSAADGAAPASGGGTTNFLRADGSWAAPGGGGGGLSQPQVMARVSFGGF